MSCVFLVVIGRVGSSCVHFGIDFMVGLGLGSKKFRLNQLMFNELM